MYLTGDRIELPEPVEYRTCELVVYPQGDPERHPGSYGIRIPQGRPSDLAQQNQEIRAIPTMFSIVSGSDKTVMMLWPHPDLAYYAEFFYNPPMKRI